MVYGLLPINKLLYISVKKVDKILNSKNGVAIHAPVKSILGQHFNFFSTKGLFSMPIFVICL